MTVKEPLTEGGNLSTVLSIDNFSLLFFNKMFLKQANSCVTHMWKIPWT